MTVSTTIAHCPRCGSVESIYIRSDDDTDLVCRSQSCREDTVPFPQENASRSPGSSFGGRR